jgi:2-dehydro-3-deoxyphosphogluconate aldolase/(4S)-4-hydroxy-2-oxoglutarate aldolase
MDIERFSRLPLMGILRGVRLEELEPLVPAVIRSGLETIEVAMNTEGAPEIIRAIGDLAQGRLVVGAGTVLTKESLEIALDAGATFAVLPALIPEVTSHCARQGVPVFPGALTPKEIFEAWNAGAAMVKVFPSSLVGPAYFKEIKGPFPEIKLLACSGVNAHNIKTYFASGASAAAFGGSIFNRRWLDDGDYRRIELEIKKLIQAATAS